jgi:tRNA dimethylallyltransferase
MVDHRQRLLIILGPTASGKSELALKLAMACDGELINADSLQVYRHLDIGTAKPPTEWREKVPHHLIDIIEPEDPFTAADFTRLAAEAIRQIVARGRRPIVVGGTGLYIKALLGGLIASPGESAELRESLREEARHAGNASLHRRLTEIDPVTAVSLHPNDIFRIIRALEVHHLTGFPISQWQARHAFHEEHYLPLKLGITIQRSLLYERINRRTEEMMTAGFREEVAALLASGIDPALKPMRSIGYKEMTAYLHGELGWDEARQAIAQATRNYAKRQMTWFARDPEIKWVEYPRDFDTIIRTVIDFFY